MAWLFLDTHTPGEFRLGWLDKNGSTRVKHYAEKAHRLLPRLARLMPRGLQDVDGICVVAGPGSFSSVRSGVLDANLLARLWRVPLVGVSAEEAKDVSTLTKRLASARGAAYVAPTYDAEPNITVRVC